MVTATAISPMFRASLADAVGWFRGALRVRDRGNVPQGRSGDGGAVPLGDWYLLSKRRSRWPGRSAGCRPVPSNRARQKARQPASPRPRTRSSNPIPSSGESANHQFRDDFTGSTSRFPALDAPPASFTQKPDALRDGKERFEQRVAELFEFASRPDLCLTGAASSDLLEIGEFDLERYGAAAKSGVLAVPPHLIHDPSKPRARLCR